MTAGKERKEGKIKISPAEFNLQGCLIDTMVSRAGNAETTFRPRLSASLVLQLPPYPPPKTTL